MRTEWLKLKSGSDIRGDAVDRPEHPALLTKEAAECIGYAFALWLAEKTGRPVDTLKLSVGRDPRLSGRALAEGLVRGMTAADCDVLDCGLCTTPAMFMTTVEPETDCDGAVMITASHHPWYKNGFKLFTREGGLDGEEIEDILRRAMVATPPVRLVESVNFLDIYTRRLGDLIRTWLEDDSKMPLLGLHVVVNAGNGSGGFYAQFLEGLGAYVDGSQFLEPDGQFPNHPPNPEDKAAIEALSRAVVENEADLGVIFDADCGRAAIVDQDGKGINKNRLIALVAAILLGERPGATFVTDSVTSSGLARFISEWGGIHYRFKRGYRNVIDEAIRLNEEGIDCPIAIETSGHAAMRENYFLDDGMYLVTRLICEAMKRKRDGLTLSSLIDELHEPVESVELRLNILAPNDREAGEEVIETVLSHTLDNPAWHLAPDNREGVRISFDLEGEVDNGWFLIRMSVHDPVMAINAESDVEGGVEQMLTELYDLIWDVEVLDLTPLKQWIESIR